MPATGFHPLGVRGALVNSTVPSERVRFQTFASPDEAMNSTTMVGKTKRQDTRQNRNTCGASLAAACRAQNGLRKC